MSLFRLSEDTNEGVEVGAGEETLLGRDLLEAIVIGTELTSKE